MKRPRALRPALLALTIALCGARAAPAHPLAPALLELEESAGGDVLVRLTAPLLASGDLPVEPLLPPACAPQGEPSVAGDATRVVAERRFACGEGGLGGAEVGAAGLAESRTDVILRIVHADGRSEQALLSAARPRYRLRADAGAGHVAAEYVRLGAQHLLGGIDHLLFVAGLFLLVPGGLRLAGTLSAFTLGHSVTLSLVALGVASPPGALVDLGIAASLVALGLEALRGERRGAATRHAAGGGLAARPWLLAAGFGLFHGMGFAGALRSVGLPAHDVPLALLSFNAGIELAQLAAALLLAAAVRTLASLRLADLGLRPPTLAAHAIGGAGAFLLLERLSSLIGP